MAISLVKLLRSMAEGGMTIICTIHQPASGVYALFDRLCLMSEGRVAFLGNCSEAIPFLDGQGYPCPPTYNPADFFIFTLYIRPGQEEECHEKTKAICDAFENSQEATEIKEMAEENSKRNVSREISSKRETSSKRDHDHESSRRDENSVQNDNGKEVSRPKKKRPNFFTQLGALFWRIEKQFKHDSLIIKIQVAQMIFLGLVLGGIYSDQKRDQKSVQNITGFFFLTMANLTWVSVYSVANIFWGEIEAFYKEYCDGTYSLPAYFLSKLVSEIPIFILLPTIYMSIGYWLVVYNFNPDFERFLVALGITILICNVATGVGHLISLSTPSLEACLLLSPVFLFPFVLVGGNFISKNSMPKFIGWLKHVSWFLYSFEALTINQWRDIDIEDCNSTTQPRCLINGKMAIEKLDFNEENFDKCIWMLCVLIVGYRTLAFCALWLKVKIHMN